MLTKQLTCQDTVPLEVEFDDEPIIVDIKFGNGEPGAALMCKVEVAEEAVGQITFNTGSYVVSTILL